MQEEEIERKREVRQACGHGSGTGKDAWQQARRRYVCMVVDGGWQRFTERNGRQT